jgi:DNA-binding NarL/FixJ family response regulator
MEALGETRTEVNPWQTVLLEGQTLLRELLARELEAQGRFAITAQLDDPLQAREICRRTWPDFVISEIDLPRGGGLEFIEYLRRNLPGTRVLVLSHLTDGWTLNRLDELGVPGFVEKGQSLEILQEAAVEVASGHTYFTAAICRIQEKLREDPNAVVRQLNRREQAVLRLVAAGLTSRAIAQQLGLSPRSVETYRYRMMRKLGIERMAGLIRFALHLRLDCAGPDRGGVAEDEPRSE